MPGDNCSVVGCGSSRRTQGIGILKNLLKKLTRYGGKCVWMLSAKLG